MSRPTISPQTLLIASLAAAFVLVLLGGVVTQLSTSGATALPESTTTAPISAPDPALSADREREYRARLDEANRRLRDQQAALEEARRRLDEPSSPQVPRAPRLERGEYEREGHREGHHDEDDDDDDDDEHSRREREPRFADGRSWGHEHDDD